jgi:competence protein ComEA
MEELKRYITVVVVAVVGIGFVIYGIWGQIKPGEVKVEIIKEKDEGQKVRIGGEIVVDVAGAVEKPGVYKIPSNSRIGDALVLSGGLAANADREWVAASLNLAQKLEDGEKIFIPDKSANQQVSDSEVQIAGKSVSTKININTASVVELDALNGIGEARAKAIVANRPYSKTEEIVIKAKIPQSVYEKISSNISVY